MTNLNRNTVQISNRSAKNITLISLLICGVSFASTTNNTKQEISLADTGLKTDFNNASADISYFKPGGSGKDGIPALTNPKFVSIAESEEDKSIQGVLVELGGEKRFYPYSILVWHELINDSISDHDFLVSYCPLSGSAIVFNRKIEGKTLEFGVSGLLYESNLLMYDRQTESLWSQAGLRCVAGEYNKTKLETLPMQLLTFDEVKRKHPQAKVLSRETGHEKNYDRMPYGLYSLSEKLYYPISKKDNRFRLKEMIYAVPFRQTSLAIPLKTLKDGSQTEVIDGVKVEVIKADKTLHATVDDKAVPGYYEMWFSWFAQYGKAGQVWPVKEDLKVSNKIPKGNSSYQGRKAAPQTPTLKKSTPKVYPRGPGSAPPTPEG